MATTEHSPYYQGLFSHYRDFLDQLAATPARDKRELLTDYFINTFPIKLAEFTASYNNDYQPCIELSHRFIIGLHTVGGIDKDTLYELLDEYGELGGLIHPTFALFRNSAQRAQLLLSILNMLNGLITDNNTDSIKTRVFSTDPINGSSLSTLLFSEKMARHIDEDMRNELTIARNTLCTNLGVARPGVAQAVSSTQELGADVQTTQAASEQVALPANTPVAIAASRPSFWQKFKQKRRQSTAAVAPESLASAHPVAPETTTTDRPATAGI